MKPDHALNDLLHVAKMPRSSFFESFFAILKSECFYSRTYHSIAELQAEIEEYLVYYNQNRIKLGLKGLSPVQYRAQYLS